MQDGLKTTFNNTKYAKKLDEKRQDNFEKALMQYKDLVAQFEKNVSESIFLQERDFDIAKLLKSLTDSLPETLEEIQPINTLLLQINEYIEKNHIEAEAIHVDLKKLETLIIDSINFKALKVSNRERLHHHQIQLRGNLKSILRPPQNFPAIEDENQEIQQIKQEERKDEKEKMEVKEERSINLDAMDSKNKEQLLQDHTELAIQLQNIVRSNLRVREKDKTNPSTTSYKLMDLLNALVKSPSPDDKELEFRVPLLLIIKEFIDKEIQQKCNSQAFESLHVLFAYSKLNTLIEKGLKQANELFIDVSLDPSNSSNCKNDHKRKDRDEDNSEEKEKEIKSVKPLKEPKTKKGKFSPKTDEEIARILQAQFDETYASNQELLNKDYEVAKRAEKEWNFPQGESYTPQKDQTVIQEKGNGEVVKNNRKKVVRFSC